jgi:hypothetical protein
MVFRTNLERETGIEPVTFSLARRYAGHTIPQIASQPLLTSLAPTGKDAPARLEATMMGGERLELSWFITNGS